MATQAELETPVAVSLDAVASLDSATLSAPAPVDMAAVVVENKLSAGAVSAPASVGYGDGVTTADPVDSESLNRNAGALASSINTTLTGWASALNDVMTDLNSDAAAQATETNAKIEAIRTAVNAALNDVRQKNVDQNGDIAAAVNARMGTVAGNLSALQTALESVDAKIVALDSVYGTDSDIATQVAAINAELEALDSSGLDLTSLLTSTTNELDTLIRVQRKVVSMTAANGVYAFTLGTEFDGLTLTAASDYTVSASVVGTSQADATVLNKVATGFDIEVRSQGVHYVPQPVDGSVTPIQLEVTVAHTPTVQVSV